MGGVRLQEIFLPECKQECKQLHSSFKTRHQADASLLVSMATVTLMCKWCDLSDHLRTNISKFGKKFGPALLR